MYKMDTVERVKSLLMSSEKLRAIMTISCNFSGVAVILLDLDRFIKVCDFSCRQKKILDLYYIKGYTQTEVAEELKITQQGVSFHLSNIDKKIKGTINRYS